MSESSAMRFEFKVDFKSVRHIATKRKSPSTHSRLYQSLILAHQLQTLFHTGKAENTKQASEWLNISLARLSQILGLLLLSPQIQEKILLSTNETLGAVTENDIRAITVKMDWEEQKSEWNKLMAKMRKETAHADIEIE